VIRVIDTIDRDRADCVRYRDTLVTVTGHWQSREGVTGDADEVAWLPPRGVSGRPVPNGVPRSNRYR
jgi:hypothetical protein